MRYLLILLLAISADAVTAAEPHPQYRVSSLQANAAGGDDGEEDEERADTVDSWLADAEQALDLGRYKTARSEYRKVVKEMPTHQAGARGLAETNAQTGDYKVAIKGLETCIKAVGTAVEPATLALLGRLQVMVGDYAAAEATGKLLVENAAAEAKDGAGRTEVIAGAVDGHVLKGHVYRLRGMYDAAKLEYDSVRQVVGALRANVMKIDKALGRQPALADLWCSAGEAYFWLNRLHDANDCWGNALIADEYHQRTNGWMARLYLEQNHDSSSRVNYSELYLKHNPFAPDLKLRLAEAYFFRWNMGGGMKQLDEALKTNPDHPEILTLRAIKYLYTDQYDEARKDYERALKTNPVHAEALGAKALHAATLGNADLYAEVEKAMLQVNPKPARFYEIIADGLSDRFRYVEALPLYAKALECNPEHWTAYKGQGMAAMNFGDDVLGKASLKTALDKDPLRNNLQTLNLLTLLDSYKNFERVVSDNGRWRLLVHKSESAVMVPMYLEALDEAWESQAKKYDFEPRKPIVVEAFHRHEDFEVRTVGITGLPALGACFGQLITLDSPSARPAGSYNWRSTLVHEMDHVFQLQISNGQIPRWLAEGCSVYEEKRTRPEWERHMEDQLFMHYHMDDIPPVKTFNEWFRDGSKILFAYYLGNVMLEYIDKKLGGLSNVRKMIEMFGQKKTPEEVFRACLKLEPEQFDKGFKDYVANERIAHLRMVPRVSQKRMDTLYFKYEDGESDVNDLVELALGYAQRGSKIDAETFLGLARVKGAEKSMGPDGARFHYTMAMLARMDEGLREAERNAKVQQHIEMAIGRGLEDFQTFLMLAQYAQRAQNADMYLHWVREANRAFPENPQPYALMYQYYMSRGQQKDAVEAAEKWMSVDENNLQIRQWLIQNVYDPGRNWEKLADMAYQALNVAPLDAGLHRARAMALRRLKKWDEAVKHFEYTRRMARGETPDEALAAEVNAILDIAATWMQAENKEKCKEALERARLLDPDNERIKTIEKELEGNSEEEEEEF